MKKICLILFFAFAITAAVGTASATVKKCVPLVGAGNQTIGNQTTTCTSTGTGVFTYQVDWAAKCTTNKVTSEIKGVGLCSNKDASNQNWDWTDPSIIQETITTSDNVNENTNCWCKMTTPAVSLWVFAFVSKDAGYCATYCAYYCATGVQYTDTTGAAFRSALFSGMGE